MQIYEDISLVELGNLLKDKIKNRKDLFTDIDIIVPNNKTAQWFKAFWLKTESSVLMNVKFHTIKDGLLSSLELDKKYKLVDRNVLRTHIIKHLVQLKKEESTNEVYKYIYDEDKLDSIRLYDLSNALSKLFIEYERENTPITGWQKTIYDNVLEELKNKNLATFNYLFKNKNGLKQGNEFVFFGFNNFDAIYNEVIEELSLTNEVVIYKITEEINHDINPMLSTAPSMAREIELMHGEICKLVQEKDVKFSDILVLCPQLNKYELEISKVFNQDNVSFPSIPYSINDSKLQSTDLSSGLKKLFEIASKGFYTRLDFSNIINNKVIQLSRGITLEDVMNWEKSLVEMNVYRNGKQVDDWDYAKKRVVLSKVSSINDIDENIVELREGKYIPYSNISFNDSSIVRFASIIDDLNKWVKEFNNDSIATEEKINTLLIELTKWFSIKNPDGYEMNKIFRKFSDEISLWKNSNFNEHNIPLNTLFYTLFDLSEESKSNVSRLFVQGVTFIDYEENVILPSKYIFIIGLSSNEFPKKKTISEIDLRKMQVDNGLNSFISQCNNAEYLYLSYVNHNLKTDEEYYPSSYILKLLENLGIKTDEIVYYNQIGIDETRTWNELFTKKEYKEKNYYTGLFDSVEVKEEIDSIVKRKIVKKVKVSEMKNFLDEPLKFKAQRLFGYEDETADKLNEEYEPFSLNSLENYNLIKSVVSYILNNPDNDLFIEGSKDVNLEVARKVFERFMIEHKIPSINEEIEDTTLINIILSGMGVVEKINKITEGKFDIIKIKEVKLDIDNEDVTLYHTGEVCISVDGNTRKYIELCGGKNNNPSAVLNMYICALMDISYLDSSEEYEVELYRGTAKQKFTVNPTLAYEILTDIYNEMYNYELNAYMPLDCVKQNLTFEQLVYDAKGQNGGWGFFKEKTIFSLYKDLGYTKFNYDVISSQMKDMLKRLVIYLVKEEA